MGMHNNYNVNENVITISKDGAYAGFVSCLDTKVYVTSNGLYLNELSNDINFKFLYYYLKYIQTQIYTLQQGAAQPGIKRENLAEIPIIIPSIEDQLKIISEFETVILTNTNMYIERIKSNEKYIELLNSGIKTLFM
jgi:restriction endonuclease S subunit